MGTYAKKKRRGNASASSHIGSDYENNPILLLAAYIVIHAVGDWREMVNGKAWLDKTPNRYCNFNELRVFFKSEWCAFVMQSFEIEPARILEMLEAELKAAKKED